MVELYFISLCLIVLSFVMVVLNSCCDKKSNFYLRVRSWWWMLLVLTLVTLCGPVGFELLLFSFATYGSFELLRVQPLSKVRLFLTSVMLPLAAFYSLTNSYIALLVFSLTVLLLIFSKPFINRTKSIVLFLYLALFLAISSMLQLLNTMPKGEQGAWLLFLFFVTQINDVSQYFWGKSCGKVPLLVSISPSKTLEGALGGIVTSSALGVIAGYYLLDWQSINGFFICMALGVVGISGDLLVSLFKRRIGVKDMGALIPGHGGLLDRIDSLLFSAPLLLWLFRLSLTP